MRRILITNDDGVLALGLEVLAKTLATRYDVYVVAPDRERSGVSHAFTLLSPLRCDLVAKGSDAAPLKTVFRCSGTPVDCVKLGLRSLFGPVRFDLVVSGINSGANLTVDTLYSGTVAGAMEALIMGYPGLAVSLVEVGGRHTATRQHYQTAADLCLEFIRQHEERIIGNRRFILNMNVPALARDHIEGFRFTSIARCRYDDYYHAHRDPHGRPYYWLDGHLVVSDERDDADVVAVRAGWVSISPLWYDLTASGAVAELESWRGSAGRKAPSRKRVGSKAPASGSARPGPRSGRTSGRAGSTAGRERRR